MLVSLRLNCKIQKHDGQRERDRQRESHLEKKNTITGMEALANMWIANWSMSRMESDLFFKQKNKQRNLKLCEEETLQITTTAGFLGVTFQSGQRTVLQSREGYDEDSSTWAAPQKTRGESSVLHQSTVWICSDWPGAVQGEHNLWNIIVFQKSHWLPPDQTHLRWKTGTETRSNRTKTDQQNTPVIQHGIYRFINAWKKCLPSNCRHETDV